MAGKRARLKRSKAGTSSPALVRDSFDRFGDDLTEVLLSYLSITEKFYFECICKQWQSLIFNKQQKIVFGSYGDSDNNTIKTPKDNYKYERLFMRLKFLIDIECHHHFNTRTVQSVINNCHYLQRFVFRGNVRKEVFRQFFELLGRRLVCLDFSRCDYIYGNFFAKTPNLKELKINRRLDHLNATHLPKLIDIQLPVNVEPLIFSAFTDKYCNQIKAITLLFDDDSSPNLLKKDLTLVARYPNLERLKLEMSWLKKYGSAFNSELKLIGTKCKRLKQLWIRSNKDSLFSVINQFSALTKLSVITDTFDQKLLGTMADLNNCSQLKNFKLKSDYLTDETFKDIHLFLPNLKTFEFTYCFENALTDETLINFSRLQSLQSLLMRGKEFTESGALQLINSCPQIQTLDINYEPSRQSVDAMCEVARRRPKHEMKLLVSLWPDKPLLTRYNKHKIPINLSIIKLY